MVGSRSPLSEYQFLAAKNIKKLQQSKKMPTSLQLDPALCRENWRPTLRDLREAKNGFIRSLQKAIEWHIRPGGDRPLLPGGFVRASYCLPTVSRDMPAVSITPTATVDAIVTPSCAAATIDDFAAR